MTEPVRAREEAAQKYPSTLQRKPVQTSSSGHDSGNTDKKITLQLTSIMNPSFI